jgi:C4-dicarboxylate transporter DctM subunit
MSPEMLGVAGLLILIVLMFFGIPVGFLLAIIGFVGFALRTSFDAAANLVAKDFFANFSSYSLTVIPMFVLMGQVAFHAGLSKRLYDFAYKQVGELRGGLAMATIIACAIFSAICGSTNACTATMGTVAIPEMKRYKYDLRLATGCVAAGGTLGILIPPSVVFIVYGVMTQESIGRLFMAGVLPGLLLTVIFIGTIYIWCRKNPILGPAGPKVSLKNKLISLSGVLETLVLFTLVMGGLFLGFFTPTEAGAVGSLGAILIAMVRKTFTWQGLKMASFETIKISCMVMVIVTGAAVFGHFLAVTRIPFNIATWAGELALPPVAVISIIILIYIIAGCFIDSLALVLLTVPIFYPVVTNLGFDSIWFGVIIVLVTQIGVLTPPLATNAFIIKGIAGDDVPLSTVFKGLYPWVAALVFCTALVVAFPLIATVLPRMMR